MGALQRQAITDRTLDQPNVSSSRQSGLQHDCCGLADLARRTRRDIGGIRRTRALSSNHLRPPGERHAPPLRGSADGTDDGVSHRSDTTIRPSTVQAEHCLAAHEGSASTQPARDPE